MISEMGVIHGRFQILHHDHRKYILAGKARCRHLVVGITNPDPTLTGKDDTDPERSTLLANPLTYFERYWMARQLLTEEGVKLEEFSIVPFPINFPELYGHYVPLDAVFYLSIYDDWGRRKLENFKKLGLATEVISERPRHEKGLSASEVRRRMVEGESWENLVPASVKELLILWKIPARLAAMQKEQCKSKSH